MRDDPFEWLNIDFHEYLDDLPNETPIYGSIEHFLSLRYDISQNKTLSKRAK